MKNLIVLLFILIAHTVSAQQDSSQASFSISGNVDIYYAYDFGQPDNHTRPGFIYAYNRHNEFNMNLGMLKAAYESKHVRANLALMAGTYANANLAAEPGVLKNIYEANAGVKISRKNNLWIDAGVFASHIGFESAIGKDCWALTRSILADNSPYYESGAKISYNSNNGKWFLSGLVLNGWQRIQRVDGNNTLAFGHQITYKPNAAITLNSSSFVGNDKPDSVKQMRYFHNLYGIFQLAEKWAITAGFDIGAEQKAKGRSQYNTWYSPVLIARYSPAPKHHINARVEYYADPKGIIIASGTPNGFKTFGYSINYDYLLLPNAIWRLEARAFDSEDKVFVKENVPSTSNYSITTSIAVSF